MGLAERPANLAQRQAVAAVGQIHLMRYYQDFFAALGLVRCIDCQTTLLGTACVALPGPCAGSMLDWLMMLLADVCSSIADTEQLERQRAIPECS